MFLAYFATVTPILDQRDIQSIWNKLRWTYSVRARRLKWATFKKRTAPREPHHSILMPPA
jgi:hypothetical protein